MNRNKSGWKFEWHREPRWWLVQPAGGSGSRNISKRDVRQNKTYNSRYSLVVTHPTTNLPIWGLCMAERTGCPILLSLWSYVTAFEVFHYITPLQTNKSRISPWIFQQVVLDSIPRHLNGCLDSQNPIFYIWLITRGLGRSGALARHGSRAAQCVEDG
jgi:hypothetical protein